jgi:hypothetical protein
MRLASSKQEPKEGAALSSTSPRSSPARTAEPIGAIASLLTLQRTHGNRFVQRLLRSGVIQTKLTVSEPGDPYEREADRVAEQIMRMQAPEVSKQPDHPHIHRMCDKCEEDVQRQAEDEEEVQRQAADEEEEVQRQAMNEEDEQIQRQAEEDDDEVVQSKQESGGGHKVDKDWETQIGELRGGGQRLPESVRDFFEPRFGYDFSQVRIHTDERAAEAARAVNALAFTVGRDVVFHAGQYSPHTDMGQRLMAHELTHVVQQSGAIPMSYASPKMEDDHIAERGANRVAPRVRFSTPAFLVQSNGMKLHRQDAIDVDLVPTPPQESDRLKKEGINLPTVSEETWRLIGGVADHAGKTLVEAEKQMIENLLKKTNMPTGTPLASSMGSRFLLHDTSGLMSAQHIQDEQTKGRGPMGAGVGAYVPRTGDATITRPDFFERRRPTTTDFEKALEEFEQPADKTLSLGEKKVTWKKRRDDLFRQVWNATNTSKRDAAFSNALAGLNLTTEEIEDEKNRQ